MIMKTLYWYVFVFITVMFIVNIYAKHFSGKHIFQNNSLALVSIFCINYLLWSILLIIYYYSIYYDKKTINKHGNKMYIREC